jgi:opacity protein-like surface antigen
MKRHFLLILAAAAALPFSASPAAGQRIDSPYRFLDHGQFLGVYGGHVGVQEGRIGIGPEAAPILGVNWALRVSGPFAIGVDVGYISTTRTVRDTVFDAVDSTFTALGEADVQLLTVMGNLRVNLTGARTWHSLQPHVVLGAGVAVDLASRSALEDEFDSTRRYDFGTSFAGQFGAGVDWFPTSRVSLKLDARNMLWKLSIPDAFRLTENGRSLPGSEWEQNLALTAGLSFHF